MKLSVDGVDQPMHFMQIVEDINQYYSTILVYSDFYIPKRKVKLSGDANVDGVILSANYEGDTYKYVIVCEDTYKLINSECNVFQGEATVKTLLNQKLGYKYETAFDSESGYWMFPKLRFNSVIDKLNAYTVFGNGGGAHFFINLGGVINSIDFKRSFTQGTPVKIEGKVVSDKFYTEWVNATPGIVNIFYHNCEGPQSEVLKLEENFGIGNLYFSDNTEKSFDLYKRRLTNEFYNNFYTTRQLVVENPVMDTPRIGALVQIGDVKTPFMISGYTAQIPVEDDKVPLLTLNLVGCPETS